MSSKKNILFVDDDVNVLNGLRRMLHNVRGEWDFEFVTKGIDALNVMQDRHFDIIISDLRMPGIDGVELLEKVRNEFPDTIRFMLSGYMDKPLRSKAARCVHQFIPKPFDAEQLKNLINRAFVLHDHLRSKNITSVLSKMRSLPVLPESYWEIVDLLSNTNCSPRRVGKLIARDMAMSAKMLQVVNSVFYGRGKKIIDPIHAVTYLGLRAVEALVLTTGVFAQIPRDLVEKFSVVSMQEHSVRVGMLAREICRTESMSDDDIEIATMAGILHDAGKMILIYGFADKFEKALNESRNNKIPLFEVERKLIETTHSEIGGYLLELWGIPNSIIEAATYHHEPEQCLSEEFGIVTAVYLANTIDHELCCELRGSWFEGINMTYLEKLNVADKLDKWRRLHLPIEAGEYEYVA